MDMAHGGQPVGYGDTDSKNSERVSSPPLVLAPTEAVHGGTVIFLHGACDTDVGLSEWIAHRLGRPFSFGHLRVVFPRAPLRRYSPAGGSESSVWFDFPQGIQYGVDEDVTGLESSMAQVGAIIRREIQAGIPADRIVLGGLSQGAILSLHVGLKFERRLAGIFALSCYLPERCLLVDELSGKTGEELSHVPVFMTHGNADWLIPVDWARMTKARLSDLGVPVTYKEYAALGHDMSKRELEDLKEWILERIPSNRLKEMVSD